MSSFESASSVEPESTGLFRAHIPDGWQQGRGAFGGLVLGTLARAILASEPDPLRTLRAFNGEVCGPVLPGPARVSVRILRRGKSLSNIEATLDQGSDILVRASGIVAATRKAPVGVHAPTAPAQPPWQDIAPVAVEAPMGPVFARHYEYRCVGPWPFSGGSEPLAAGYIREKVSPARLDVPAILGYLDAYWPAYLALVSAPVALATVSYTAELMTDPTALDSQTPLFHIGRLTSHSDGFMVEMRELWSGPVLVALNQQTFAFI